jgi:hypothetical protein
MLDKSVDAIEKSERKEVSEEKKKWLFKENIRLEQLRKQLEEERNIIDIQKGLLERQQSKNKLLRQQLEGQKNLFDRQWQLLETETRRLAIDKEKFERDRQVLRDQVYREARRSMHQAETASLFFKGVNDTTSLKKRYKDLLKIFHPDNQHGDKDLIQAINKEYENLKRYYLGT